jgi:hypothetical protein
MLTITGHTISPTPITSNTKDGLLVWLKGKFEIEKCKFQQIRDREKGNVEYKLS